LGREFTADELQPEEPLSNRNVNTNEVWRVTRARNKWQATEDCSRHPIPGTYPVVMTGETEWGGWRVPGAEYDLDPLKVERQAHMIAAAPRLASVARTLIEWARKSGEEMPAELAQLAHSAQDVLAKVDGTEPAS
jgi:hypothetical protein